MREKNTPISSIGEFGLIERLKTRIASLNLPVELKERIVTGIGDDAAVVKSSQDKFTLLTSDFLIEGIHFDLTYTSFEHLGWKLMVANLSDIAAMCGVPLYAIVNIALPSKISLEMADKLYQGVSRASETYRCAVIGGDTNTTLGNMAISATIAGEVSKSEIKQRDRAQPGDLICLSGATGLSHGGLKILIREKDRYDKKGGEEYKADISDYSEAVTRHLAPKARFDVSQIIGKQKWTHAVIDVSDGLIPDLSHICKESEVGALLYEEKILTHPIVSKIAEMFNESPLQYMLYGGEDYELLYTIHPEGEKELLSYLPETMIIGEIIDRKNEILLKNNKGEKRAVPAGGWDHFRKDS